MAVSTTVFHQLILETTRRTLTEIKTRQLPSVKGSFITALTPAPSYGSEVFLLIN
jgi:hypothetical protein